MLKPELNVSKHFHKSLTKVALASIVITVTNNIPALALTLNFSYGDGTTIEQMSAFEAAGDVWSTYFTDDITLNIHVDMTDLLPDNVLGGAIPGFINDEDYRRYAVALEADATSQDDVSAYSYIDKNKAQNIKIGDLLIEDVKAIDITRANAKAVGLREAHNPTMDAYILMNDLSGNPLLHWNYDFANPIQGLDYLKLDFYSVALHEIGHALGFVSGLDNKETFFQEVSSAINQTEKLDIDDINVLGIEQALDEVLDEETAIFNQLVTDYNANNYDINPATSLDLFRQSAATQGTKNLIDLTVGADAFFAIDDNSQLAYFSTGEDTAAGGDGYQGSHWKHQGYFNDPLGIMAPSIGLGQRRAITELDLIALDVIGFDRAANSNIDISQIATDVASRVGDHLIADKTNEVLDMIAESEVYQWGFGGGDGDGCDPSTQNCGSSQVLAEILTDEGLFSQAYWSTLDIKSEPIEVPETSPITSLLALSLLSFGGLVKGKSSNN